MDLIGSMSGNQPLPQDDQMMQFELQRRLKLADSLRNQDAPQGQMVSGHYVPASWTQHAANALGKLMGGIQEGNAMKQYGDYQQGKQKRLADALGTLNTDTAPKPITEQSSYQIQVPNGQAPSEGNQLGGMQPYNTSMKSIDVPMTQTTGQRMPTSEERDASMYKFAVATQNPELMSKVAFGQIDKQDQQEAIKEKHEYDAGVKANEQKFQMIMEDIKNNHAVSNQDRQFANQWNLQKSSQGFTAGENVKNRANTNANTAPVAVLDANGNPTYVPRNQAVGRQPYNASQPVTTQQGKINDAKDVLSILNQAEPLIGQSTSSGIGSMADATQNFFGGTNKGAQAAAQLKALEGSLVSKMPKMSGPQSDKDVLLYKQMAGQIGDSTIPAAQKRAAMDTIKEINQRYLNNTQGGNARQSVNTKVINGVTYVNDSQGWHPQ